MQKDIHNVTDELVDAGSNFAASLGINRVAGQLYVLLYLSDRALSLDEMMQRLKISKGYVSTNIRALERWQAVRKVWVKGTRKDYYQANTDTISIVINQLEYGLKHRFSELDKVIKKAKSNMKKVEVSKNFDLKEKRNFEKRIEAVEKMHNKMFRILGKIKFLKILK